MVSLVPADARAASGDVVLSVTLTPRPDVRRRSRSGSFSLGDSEVSAARLRDDRFVVATRTERRQLQLIGVRVRPDGSFERLGDNGAPDVEIDLGLCLVRAGPGHVVTACRTPAGGLRMIVWRVTGRGAIVRTGDSGPGAELAGTIWATTISSEMVVTAIRNEQGLLDLMTWRVRSDGSIVRLHEHVAVEDEVEEAAMTRVPVAGPNDRVATAVRTRDGRLRVIAWDVDRFGRIRRRGASGDHEPGRLIQAAWRPGGRVFASFVDERGGLGIAEWRIRGDSVDLIAENPSDRRVQTDANLGLLRRDGYDVLAAIRSSAGTLRLLPFWTSEGTIERVGTPSPADPLGVSASVIATGRERPSIVGAVVRPDGALQFVSWTDDVPF